MNVGISSLSQQWIVSQFYRWSTPVRSRRTPCSLPVLPHVPIATTWLHPPPFPYTTSTQRPQPPLNLTDPTSNFAGFVRGHNSFPKFSAIMFSPHYGSFAVLHTLVGSWKRRILLCTEMPVAVIWGPSRFL